MMINVSQILHSICKKTPGGSIQVRTHGKARPLQHKMLRTLLAMTSRHALSTCVQRVSMELKIPRQLSALKIGAIVSVCQSYSSEHLQED